jgi:hypothetical protein
MIKNVREENMEQPEDIAFAWQPATLQRAMGGGDTESDGPNCETTYHIVGPLLQTAWGTAGWI